MKLQVLKRLTSRRAKAGSGAAIATLALLGSGLAASTAPAASVEAPAAPVVKQQATMGAKKMQTQQQQQKMRCRIPRCFGAITLAFGDTVAGLSNRAPTKRRAWRQAAADCRRSSSFPCRRIVWVRNGCAAIAVKTQGRRVHKYGWATGYKNPRPAKRAAKRKCKSTRPVGRPCMKTAWVCTPRRY